MGVIKLFSSDSRDCGSGSFKKPPYEVKVERIQSTPDPYDFEVRETVIINGYPICWVQYPNVDNYEGNKILMYPKHFDMNKVKDRMDPHFLDKGDSPIARFQPTQYGWELAIKLARAL